MGSSPGKGTNKANQRQHRTHAPQYAAYLSGDRYNVNKARKLIRHLRRFPDHRQALHRLNQIPAVALKKAKRMFTGPMPQGIDS